MGVQILPGDCREVLPGTTGITAVVSDPPYGLGFMGKDWDHSVPGPDYWRIILEACVPGAPLLAFGGTRTYHRLMCSIEDAGWEIRDCIMWVYGTGFPKSHNISKGIDKAAGVDRPVLGVAAEFERDGANRSPEKHNTIPHGSQGGHGFKSRHDAEVTAAATPSAQLWDGYGTALKPAWEPIIVAMKPLDGTYAANAQEHGVAGLNVDGGRVAANASEWITKKSPTGTFSQDDRPWKHRLTGDEVVSGGTQGRWPANLIHDGSQQVMDLFPDSKGAMGNVKGTESSHTGVNAYGEYGRVPSQKRGDDGSAARFFYCAKASKAERHIGCGPIPEPATKHGATFRHCETAEWKGNDHPTVKPLALMKYLCGLVTMPERNLILDPFCGSGTTGMACKELGLDCILIDKDEHACEIAEARVSATNS